MNRQLQSIGSRMRGATAIALLLLPCTFAAAQDTAPISALEVKYRHQIFENERVAVFLLEIPPNHASLMHRHDTDILSVFMAGGETKGTIFGNPPKVDKFNIGEVRFRPAGFTHATENIGANVFRSVILEFKSSMGAIETSKPPDSRYCTPGSETACVSEKYLFCTAGFCAKEVSIAPGAVWRSNESVSDQMLVAVSDCKLSGQPKDKAVPVRSLKSGEVENLTGSSARQWVNVAGEPARIIAVVFR